MLLVPALLLGLAFNPGSGAARSNRPEAALGSSAFGPSGLPAQPAPASKRLGPRSASPTERTASLDAGGADHGCLLLDEHGFGAVVARLAFPARDARLALMRRALLFPFHSFW